MIMFKRDNYLCSEMKKRHSVTGVDGRVDIDLLAGWACVCCPMSWKSLLNCLKQIWNYTDGVDTVDKLNKVSNQKK